MKYLKPYKTFEAYVDNNGDLHWGDDTVTIENVDKWDAINTWSQKSDLVHPIFNIAISEIMNDISDMDSYEDIEDDKESYLKDWSDKYNSDIELLENKEKRSAISDRLFNDLVEMSKDENVLQNYVDELNKKKG